MENLEKLYAETCELFEKFKANHLAAMKGMKVANRRARVVSVQLRKALKDYRELSPKE
jgi:hypothetical protein